MNTNDLRQQTREELLKTAANLRGEIRDLRFKISTRQHSKVRTLRHTAHDLARVLTVLREKQTTTPATHV
ncbi:50S ribosomal protein L29 [Candidatus Uhrbacteria bacterium]|nr:50S ribosomal protein L29 [Candidatus Uhrbacteria bacterium]